MQENEVFGVAEAEKRPTRRVPITVRAVPRARNRLFAIMLAFAAFAAFAIAIGTSLLLHYSQAHHHALFHIL
ncbi:MAG: hypothetical protein ACREFD_16045 [Stellaceae bacterium]